MEFWLFLLCQRLINSKITSTRNYLLVFYFHQVLIDFSFVFTQSSESQKKNCYMKGGFKNDIVTPLHRCELDRKQQDAIVYLKNLFKK